MDLFDFLPILPPSGPGESRERSRGHRLAWGVGSAVLPGITFAVVLFANFAQDARVAFGVMPAASGVAVYVLGRRLSVDPAWTLVFAMCSAGFCFVAGGVALLLVELTTF